mmetsp:Transcript_107590/g.302939  ORF Transcript_107590/g.302939 Transcript_107590/m.302939 type:complete len:99 (+) Transcript_107590:3-299(+)
MHVHVLRARRAATDARHFVLVFVRRLQSIPVDFNPSTQKSELGNQPQGACAATGMGPILSFLFDTFRVASAPFFLYVDHVDVDILCFYSISSSTPEEM